MRVEGIGFASDIVAAQFKAFSLKRSAYRMRIVTSFAIGVLWALAVLMLAQTADTARDLAVAVVVFVFGLPNLHSGWENWKAFSDPNFTAGPSKDFGEA
jgi:hypothetical protein